jgi:hypothetical protein
MSSYNSPLSGSSSLDFCSHTIEELPSLGHENFENLYYLVVCKLMHLYRDIQTRFGCKFISLDQTLHERGRDGQGSSPFTVRDARNFIISAWHVLHGSELTDHFDKAIKERKYMFLASSGMLGVATPQSFRTSSDASAMEETVTIQGLSTDRNPHALLDIVYKKYGFGSYSEMNTARAAPELLEVLPAVSMSDFPAPRTQTPLESPQPVALAETPQSASAVGTPQSVSILGGAQSVTTVGSQQSVTAVESEQTLSVVESQQSASTIESLPSVSPVQEWLPAVPEFPVTMHMAPPTIQLSGEGEPEVSVEESPLNTGVGATTFGPGSLLLIPSNTVELSLYVLMQEQGNVEGRRVRINPGSPPLMIHTGSDLGNAPNLTQGPHLNLVFLDQSMVAQPEMASASHIPDLTASALPPHAEPVANGTQVATTPPTQETFESPFVAPSSLPVNAGGDDSDAAPQVSQLEDGGLGNGTEPRRHRTRFSGFRLARTLHTISAMHFGRQSSGPRVSEMRDRIGRLFRYPHH